MHPRDIIGLCLFLVIVVVLGVLFIPNSPPADPIVWPSPTTVSDLTSTPTLTPLDPPVVRECQPPDQREACNAYWFAVATARAGNKHDAHKVRHLYRVWQEVRHHG